MKITQNKIDNVVIEFEVIDGDYSFQDKIEMTAEEYKAKKQTDIDDEIESRFNVWKGHMTKPNKNEKDFHAKDERQLKYAKK